GIPAVRGNEVDVERQAGRHAGSMAAGAKLSGLDGIRADDDRVHDLRDLVGRHARALGLLAHLVGAGALVDADRPEVARLLLHHVGADPADVVGHLLSDFGGTGGSGLQLLGGTPEVAAADDVQVHLPTLCDRAWGCNEGATLRFTASPTDGRPRTRDTG